MKSLSANRIAVLFLSTAVMCCQVMQRFGNFACL